MKKPEILDQSLCWHAVLSRTDNGDGSFYYGVKTTGIYCRPGCSSRLPKRENVEFFPSCEEAEAKGYRACKKCRPTELGKEHYLKEKIVTACRIIESSSEHIKLADLAAEVGLSPYHFHRLFKKYLGVTPKQYSMYRQSVRFGDHVKSSGSVTEAIYEAGFGSNSVAYQKRNRKLGMKPKILKKGGEGLTIRYGISSCYLGAIIVATTGRGVCAIEFADDPEDLPTLVQARFPKAKLMEGGGDFVELLEMVVRSIEVPQQAHNIPLEIQGTAFQLQVWEVVGSINCGQTLTYTEVAERMGKPQAARAVASAIAANSLAVVIPCHRVVGKDGRLAGYRWGIERKQQLLAKERTEET
ncbi:bifunctional DNA-binding transcriptional regulator/O6-methylguanine-DNA methyltransferase Ada [Desulfosediminicola ganghwensis]|uniref:bifunctional DNA-binding transcriptional regulator/O6-methylguanine-DNA methyltransferase Ada n=1 Tax=Desulfosediminicola ganghwensis TaxID=2569540 RepID=UPI001C3E4F40|nr:bifunctional DNA-binding transcriptional regulator/O6-methylguanine-DNA methyltransferase Ada [Desulfosediminicola ganghwensis]